MSVVNWIQQAPEPGALLLRWQGEIETFTLRLTGPQEGGAWLRTNLGHAGITRREILREVEHGETRMACDWFDVAMPEVAPGVFRVSLPLAEVGHFEAKAYFLPAGGLDPAWPSGPNVRLGVQPANTCAGNIIYNAFVRQFGRSKKSRTAKPEQERLIAELDHEGYAVIPPSGTFRDLIGELDFIVGTLGCQVLQLLPVHPTPTTYGRMGRFGSPYAALSFTAVDPALAQFDPSATPLEQFIELVDAVHAREATLLIDIAINHTGWAASLHEAHPEWLARDPQGRIEVPGAWGVRWEDLTKLDFGHRGLWRYMADVFLTWCRRGVDGFRCDAGYMIPTPAWQYIIAVVRDQFPDTIFLLEGLGGKVSVTRELLGSAGFNWAYSELFQNYDRGQIESYIPEALSISREAGLAVHYAETHDNNRLASISPTWARMRTALCALLAPAGAFGFANGVEWFATEKIVVHDASPLNWGAESNQVAEIGRLSALLSSHPAFRGGTELRLIGHGPGNFLALLRRAPAESAAAGSPLIVLANLDADRDTPAAWEKTASGQTFVDLLGGGRWQPQERGDEMALTLAPGQVLCLSPADEDLPRLQQAMEDRSVRTAPCLHQRLRAKVLEIMSRHPDRPSIDGLDLDKAAMELGRDPFSFCNRMNKKGGEPSTVIWNWPADSRREVMIPPAFFLLVTAPAHFHVQLVAGERTIAHDRSYARGDGSHFSLLAPPADLDLPARIRIRLTVYAPAAMDGQPSPFSPNHTEGTLVFLAPASAAPLIRLDYTREALLRDAPLFLGTDGRGSMMRASAAWGRLTSRYDALLAANLHPDHPVDRQVMLTRLRAWLVYQGNSHELALECLEDFHLADHGVARWRFLVPCGQGEHVRLTIEASMPEGMPASRFRFYRHPAGRRRNHLPDERRIQLILRPDLEDRSFHELTKAHSGPEHRFPAAVRSDPGGFAFAPHPEHHCLSVHVREGNFFPAPEWQYMVNRALDAERGHEPNGDLFSPGYFATLIGGGASEWLEACARLPAAAPVDSEAGFPDSQDALSTGDRLHRPPRRPLVDVLAATLGQFVVRRGSFKSVIAGYPWFLDWGRDSLIVVRGLVAAGQLEAARAVLMQFGRFEDRGTLPNMICGEDAGNRDTSDASLWFCVACADLAAATGKEERFWETPCGGRSLREVLLSIGRHYVAGTPNGILVDRSSALVFSPSHFTWMDTDHPAGTPRQGYAIEIQALWYRTLGVLHRLDRQRKQGPWEALQRQVRESLTALFWDEAEGYLLDCRHAAPGQTAAAAEPDQALRPNQLLALTLGAVTAAGQCRRVLEACAELIVPGAIRSLADRPVRRPLPVVHHGRPLNDPRHPYQGRYLGDEDSQRKPAYHNGTAWTWLFPHFCEAWAMAYGAQGRATAKALLTGSAQLVRFGCAGHLPEILDGDAPHHQRGCDAQAWGTSEWLRVWHQLEK